MKDRPNIHPVACGPRLQAGDLLRIKEQDYIVLSLRKGKVVCRYFASPTARDFSVTEAYALAYRKKPPRRLPQTAAMLQLLRKGTNCTSTLVDAAAAEKHLDAVDRQGQTALMLAASCGLVNELNSLLAHGVDVNARGFDGETALLKASASRGGRNQQAVRALLSHNARVDCPSLGAEGLTALHISSAAGHSEVVRLLCESGACVETPAKTCERQ